MAAAMSRITNGIRGMGPSWIAGAIAAGPATMASLVTGGAVFGYDLLWVVVLSAILGTLAQYLAMRLGLLTERGIVGVVEDALGNGWAWLLVGDAVLAAGLAQLVIMFTLASVSTALFGQSLTVWAVVWAVVLAVGLAGGGYRVAEWGAKLIVAFVVLAFAASLFVVPIDAGAAVGGLVPTIPQNAGGVSGTLVVAGILGGAIHITLITMHSYTMRAREWTLDDADTATVDVVGSMGVAFGIYSLAIFLVVASVLHGQVGDDVTALEAARSLGPLVGPFAERLFLAGLLGAAVSTLGGNTVVPPYLVADKLGWGTDLHDFRYRVALAATALLSAAAALIGSTVPFLPLLVLVIAFGLLGTPFAIAVVLYLLNDPDTVPHTASTPVTLAGVVLFLVVCAVNVLQLADRIGIEAGSSPGELVDQLLGLGAVDAFVVAFGVLVGAATLVVFARFLRRLVARPAPRPSRSD